MRARKRQTVSHVEDRAGRRWTVTVTSLDQNEELEPWRDMTGDERVELIGECVLDGLRLEGKRDIPRLRRVHRVLERESREVSGRRGVRRRDGGTKSKK
jgi:hypothetical protein